MFDQIFKCPRAIKRHLAAPFLEQRLSYLDHYAAQGASLRSLRLVAADLLSIIACLDLQPEGEISQRELEKAADRWITRPAQVYRRKDSSATRIKFLIYGRHWLDYLNRLQPVPISPCPEASFLSQFANYMKYERGLSALTIRLRFGQIADFLRRVCSDGRLLDDITITDIDEAMTQKLKGSRYCRATIQTYGSTLRSFFRYAESRGRCTPGIAEAIISPRVFQEETLPAGPSWEDVQRLLSGVAGESRTEIRDRAILLLFAVYGLRVSEVRRLCLEDLDWERELIFVHRSKQRPRIQTCPLTRTVGDAILLYLKEVRPHCQHREVFVTLKTPLKPLSSSAFWQIVSRRLRSLKLPLKHHGPHALRHACAAHLLAEGLSMKEIGDHLGHRSSAATAHYAKVDLVGLRKVADLSLGGLI